MGDKKILKPLSMRIDEQLVIQYKKILLDKKTSLTEDVKQHMIRTIETEKEKKRRKS